MGQHITSDKTYSPYLHKCKACGGRRFEHPRRVYVMYDGVCFGVFV